MRSLRGWNLLALMVVAFVVPSVQAAEVKLTGPFAPFAPSALLGNAYPGYLKDAGAVLQGGKLTCLKVAAAQNLTWSGSQHLALLVSRWALEGDSCATGSSMASGAPGCDVLVYQKSPDGVRLVSRGGGLSACSSVGSEPLMLEEAPLIHVTTAWMNHGIGTTEEILLRYAGPSLDKVWSMTMTEDGNALNPSDAQPTISLSTSRNAAPNSTLLEVLKDYGADRVVVAETYSFNGKRFVDPVSVPVLRADRGWQRTNVVAAAGKVVTVSGAGTWNTSKDAGWECDAGGTQRATFFEHRVTKMALMGAIICKVTGSAQMYGGANFRFLADVSGEAQCRVNETDAWLNDNSGALYLAVTVEK